MNRSQAGETGRLAEQVLLESTHPTTAEESSIKTITLHLARKGLHMAYFHLLLEHASLTTAEFNKTFTEPGVILFTLSHKTGKKKTVSKPTL